MEFKIVIFSFVLGSHLFAQDSTLALTKTPVVADIVTRFDQITGPDLNCSDAMEMMRNDLLFQIAQNKRLKDSLIVAKRQIIQLHRTALVDKYGDPTKKVKYDQAQYQDFKKNLYLQDLLNRPNTLLFFFPINSANIDYTLYEELKNVKLKCDNSKDYKIYITSYTDQTGDEKINSALEKQRSESLKKYLIDELKMKESKIIFQAQNITNDRIEDQELDFVNRRAIMFYEIEN